MLPDICISRLLPFLMLRSDKLTLTLMPHFWRRDAEDESGTKSFQALLLVVQHVTKDVLGGGDLPHFDAVRTLSSLLDGGDKGFHPIHDALLL